MDPYLAQMYLQGPQSEEVQRATANALRGMSETGGRLSTSSIPEAAKQGALMQERADDQAKQTGLMQYRAADLKAAEDYNKVRLAKATGGTGFHLLSNKRTEALEKEASNAAVVTGLGRKLEETALPGMGGTRNFLAGSFLSGLLTDKASADAESWRNWDMEYNNITRHGLFGSALTATEAALWKKSNVTPNMTQDQIAAHMQNMELIQNSKLSNRVISLMHQVGPEQQQWVYDLYSEALPEEFWVDPTGYRAQVNDIIESGGYVTDVGSRKASEYSDAELRATAARRK